MPRQSRSRSTSLRRPSYRSRSRSRSSTRHSRRHTESSHKYNSNYKSNHHSSRTRDVEHSSRKYHSGESSDEHYSSSSRRKRSVSFSSYSSEEEKERERRSNRSKKSKKDKEKSRKKKEKKAKRDHLKHEEEKQSFIEMSVYSDANNPFNDMNLGQKFEWVKKKERDKKMGISTEEAMKLERDRKEETKLELEKLTKRRAEREIERQLREEEQARKQREAEAVLLGDWASKEDEFHLEQANRRAEIRIKENRAKPIDILAINLRLADEGDDVDDSLEIDVDEPYTIFENLNLQEVEELHQDIQLYLNLERNPDNLDFWRAMIVVCDDKLSELRAEAEPSNNTNNVIAPIKNDLDKIFAGKTYDQLRDLQVRIQEKLTGGEAVDVEYWELQLKLSTVWKAKAKLKAMHEIVLQKRLAQLRRKQRQEAIKVQEELETALNTHPASGTIGAGDTIETGDIELTMDEDSEGLIEEYDRSMSPEPLPVLSREDKMLEIRDPNDDLVHLRQKRKEVLRNQYIPMKVPKRTSPEEELEESTVSKVLYEREAAKDLDEDEAIFNIEEELAKTTYLWQDKYRPRKPRYFNRVHTGYEWNKYNQTHYDSDNPPPKVVQGYKFNIFYPDLIDKTKAPTYKIEREHGNTDTVLIRFIAGPPYEDIAFRIVNREWEYSHKKGFKSSFDRGVLQLHFHFKRHYYRR
ncbi:11828_t:CDS:10 [Ambispora gerdemannii]|uniref:Splicing factor Cactin n=1 Tax=Ambispora gerdemannii TaxID=144530 RepID=A0A9N8VH13_9GLOM|nr:11828_t:CDS:10 [Ambispora gerdemannii]